MQSRWTTVGTGFMAGIIAVLLTVVIMQNREPQAWAAPQSVDNTGAGLMTAVGGTQPQMYDILWVMYKRPNPHKNDKEPLLSKEERITLCAYQMGGRGAMKLVSVRDISYDMDLVEFQNEKPAVKEIMEGLKKTLEKPTK